MSLSHESKVQMKLMGERIYWCYLWINFKANFLKHFPLFKSHFYTLLLHTSDKRCVGKNSEI